MIGPYPITALNCQSAPLNTAVRHAFSGVRFDAVHLDSVQLFPLVAMIEKLQPRVPVIFDWHNIDSEVMSRFSTASAPLLQRFYARHTAPRIARLEKRALWTAHGHLVCSEREAALVSATVPDARVAVIPNGVDFAYFAAVQPSGSADRLVFVASMDYQPNIEAAIDFSHTKWPAIRARFPDLRLSLVGARPVALVRKLSELPGVEVTGTVETVRPYYAGAVAAIVPVLTGGGTRLKILEAMAAGVPVITTRAGGEGLPIEDGGMVLFAETAEDWVRRIGDVIHDTNVRSELVARAREFVCTRYSWDQIGDRLRSVYSEWLTR